MTNPMSWQPGSHHMIMQVLGRGICNGCWNVRSTLQSECGKCKVGACKACRDQWALQRRQGTHATEEGLLVHQANVCFCGAHLTLRGAALYDRKVGCCHDQLCSCGMQHAAWPCSCVPWQQQTVPPHVDLVCLCT